MARKLIGTKEHPGCVTVRGIPHFSECLVAQWPEHPDEDCTCHDDSPDWDRG